MLEFDIFCIFSKSAEGGSASVASGGSKAPFKEEKEDPSV